MLLMMIIVKMTQNTSFSSNIVETIESTLVDDDMDEMIKSAPFDDSSIKTV